MGCKMSMLKYLFPEAWSQQKCKKIYFDCEVVVCSQINEWIETKFHISRCISGSFRSFCSQCYMSENWITSQHQTFWFWLCQSRSWFAWTNFSQDSTDALFDEQQQHTSEQCVGKQDIGLADALMVFARHPAHLANPNPSTPASVSKKCCTAKQGHPWISLALGRWEPGDAGSGCAP